MLFFFFVNPNKYKVYNRKEKEDIIMSFETKKLKSLKDVKKHNSKGYRELFNNINAYSDFGVEHNLMIGDIITDKDLIETEKELLWNMNNSITNLTDEIGNESYVNGYKRGAHDVAKMYKIIVAGAFVIGFHVDNFDSVNNNVKKGFNKVKGLFSKKKEKSNEVIEIYHDVEDL